MPSLCNVNIISTPVLKVVGEDPKEASEGPIDSYRPSRWLIYALFWPMMPFSCPFAYLFGTVQTRGWLTLLSGFESIHSIFRKFWHENFFICRYGLFKFGWLGTFRVRKLWLGTKVQLITSVRNFLSSHIYLIFLSYFLHF